MTTLRLPSKTMLQRMLLKTQKKIVLLSRLIRHDPNMCEEWRELT